MTCFSSRSIRSQLITFARLAPFASEFFLCFCWREKVGWISRLSWNCQRIQSLSRRLCLLFYHSDYMIQTPNSLVFHECVNGVNKCVCFLSKNWTVTVFDCNRIVQNTKNGIWSTGILLRVRNNEMFHSKHRKFTRRLLANEMLMSTLFKCNVLSLT